jgi:hypothetical protein
MKEMKPWFADGDAWSAETIIPRITAHATGGCSRLRKAKTCMVQGDPAQAANNGKGLADNGPGWPNAESQPEARAAEDLRRARLIADVFADFERLLAAPKRSPVGGDAWLAPASLIRRRIAIAKGQQRGNREAKKPRKEKPKVAATAQASFGLNPSKSAGAKDDRGKKK